MEEELGQIAGQMDGKVSEALQEMLELVKTTKNSVESDDSIKISSPVNPLDPVVSFDPDYGFSKIAVPYSHGSEDESIEPNGDVNTINPLKVDAIKMPLVKLNNKVLVNNTIEYMDISIIEFLPKITLTVQDINGNIQATDVPGMNNIITVILTAAVDGASKKISLDFYIDNCTFNDDGTITYNGTFRLIGLKQRKNKQIGSDKLSTYEMLESIAKELKLGFAVSKNCKEIEDKRYRNIYSKSYTDYIINCISYSGLDDKSVFDTWIDAFGYLVLVNLSTIMSENIKPSQLSTKVIRGFTDTMAINDSPGQKVEEVIRMITNSREYQSGHNLYFDDYKSDVDNSKIVSKGTSNKYYYLTSPCDENLIQTKDVVVVEESVDGIEGVDEYAFENIEFIGVEQEEEFPILVQKEIVTNFMNKFNSNKLIVTLPIANYSLERGMLLNVYLEEYNGINKRFIIQNYQNVSATEKQEDEDNKAELNADTIEASIDENNGVLNPSLSGIYYIHGINYLYFGDNEVSQKLTLIKKGNKNRISNKYTNPHAENEG